MEGGTGVTTDAMPQITRIEEAAGLIDQLFLHTPVVRRQAQDREPGREILLKVETLTPIRSFKGRGAGWLLHRLRRDAEAGLVCASADKFCQGPIGAKITLAV
jgi:threonine dehydratase